MTEESESKSAETGVSERQGELSKSLEEAIASVSLRTDDPCRTESSAERSVMTDVTSP